jgi:acyl-CoA thioester hydrolase
MAEPHVTTQKLRFCDTDMLGHVNNATYAMLFEAGRVELVAPLNLFSGPHVFVIARLEIDFLRELNWPGEVRVETAVARFGTRSLHVRQSLVVDGETVSRARSVIAVMDTATRRAVPLREEWRAALAQWHMPDEAP